MKFETNINLPLELGKPTEYYSAKLDNFRVLPGIVNPMFSGFIRIENEVRQIVGGLEDGRCTMIEVEEIFPKDVIVSVPLNLDKEEFVEELRLANLDAYTHKDTVYLLDEKMTFWYDNDHLATLGWWDPAYWSDMRFVDNIFGTTSI